MHLVYSNAIFNIAASGAHNSEAGCFRGRDPGLGVPAKLRLSRGSIVLIPTPDILAATITDGALAQRAWVLQEQLLARRVLYFGEQLFWECAENWACETLPDGTTDMLKLLGDPYYLSIKRRIQGLILSPNMNSTPGLYRTSCTTHGISFAGSIPGEFYPERATKQLRCPAS